MMNFLRESDPWVIRTDFSDEDRWLTVIDLISAPQRDFDMDFFAHVKFVTNEKHRDREPQDVVMSLPDHYPEMFCFVVDRGCIENQEYPVLVIGFDPNDLQLLNIVTFRALPSQIQAIQNNLSIANMDFADFANSVDSDGVFRGFPR